MCLSRGFTPEDLQLRNDMGSKLKGKSYNGLDAKGRLIVPTRLRAGLGESFVLCQGMDHNLYAYPNSEWDEFSEKLSKLPLSNPKTRRFREFFEGSATECEMDGQFRIVIPQQLREFAGIDKDVVVVGHTNFVAIWNKDAWDKMHEDEADTIEELSEEIGEAYGI